MRVVRAHLILGHGALLRKVGYAAASHEVAGAAMVLVGGAQVLMVLLEVKWPVAPWCRLVARRF